MTFEEFLRNNASTGLVPAVPTQHQLEFAKAYDLAVHDGYDLSIGGHRNGRTWLLRRLEEYWKQEFS